MHIGLAVPQVPVEAPIDVQHLVTFARESEEAGFDSLWTTDHRPEAGAAEPLTLLALLSGVTDTVRLGVGVVSVPRHVPLQLAATLASIDLISRGRLIVGLGAGGDQVFSPAYGTQDGDRAGRMDETLTVLAAAWSEGPARHEGRHWRIDDLDVRCKPIQLPRPPIWIGARRRPALRRAVIHADGWLGAGSSSVDDFLLQAEVIAELTEEYGTRTQPFGIGKRVYLSLSGPRQASLENERRWFDVTYGVPSLAEETAIVGSIEHLKDTLALLIDSGARLLVLDPLYHRPDDLEVLAGEVLPWLRAIAPDNGHAPPVRIETHLEKDHR